MRWLGAYLSITTRPMTWVTACPVDCVVDGGRRPAVAAEVKGTWRAMRLGKVDLLINLEGLVVRFTAGRVFRPGAPLRC